MAESETNSADPANALSIFSSFKNSLETELGLDLKELVRFFSDGASVMTGKNHGLAARFNHLDEFNTILSVHCIYHPLTFLKWPDIYL